MSAKHLPNGNNSGFPIHYVDNLLVTIPLRYTKVGPAIFGSYERAFLRNVRF